MFQSNTYIPFHVWCMTNPWVQSLPLAIARQPGRHGRSTGCSVSARPQRCSFSKNRSLAKASNFWKTTNHELHGSIHSDLVVPSWPHACLGVGSYSIRLGEECWRLQLRWTSFATDASTSDSRWFNSNLLVDMPNSLFIAFQNFHQHQPSQRMTFPAIWRYEKLFC